VIVWVWKKDKIISAQRAGAYGKMKKRGVEQNDASRQVGQEKIGQREREREKGGGEGGRWSDGVQEKEGSRLKGTGPRKMNISLDWKNDNANMD